MSQVPPPMPDPQQYAVPMARPLQYAQPLRAKPGVITAVGITSIVLGSLGIMTNLGLGLQGAVFWLMTSMAPGMFSQGAGAAMTPGQSQLIVSTWSQFRPLSPRRRQVLDRFLLDQGAKILDTASAAVVRSDALSSGALPVTSPG